jgi:hypothetical protein
MEDNDDAIRAAVRRLSRPDRSGAMVIERAAILAAGTDSTAMLEWILAHAGEPEAIEAPASRPGLHGARLTAAAAPARQARRYVLPAGTFG